MRIIKSVVSFPIQSSLVINSWQKIFQLHKHLTKRKYDNLKTYKMKQSLPTPNQFVPIGLQLPLVYLTPQMIPIMLIPQTFFHPFQSQNQVKEEFNQAPANFPLKTDLSCKTESQESSKNDINIGLQLLPKKEETTNSETKELKRGKIWTKEEKDRLCDLYVKNEGRWNEIIKHFKGRNISQCSQKYRKISENRREKSKWTLEEDSILLGEISQKGKSWVQIAKSLPGRTSKQVRDRYINKLDPSLKSTEWTEEEDRIIYDQYLQIGAKWTLIAEILQGRSENQVKNRFYYHVQSKYFGMKHEYLREQV